MPINRKTKHSDLREKLRVLKINLNRVYAIQRPAKNIVSLLIHAGYAQEILDICAKEGIHPITDFNPIASANLGDPKLLESLTEVQLNDKAKAIYYNRMLQAAAQIRDSRLGLTILKYFNSKDNTDCHAIPDVIVEQFLKLKPTAVRKIKSANTANTVLKGFDAANLFASLATPPVSSPPVASNSTISEAHNILAVSPGNAGNRPMDTTQ